jgi:uncharacterized membrane protein YhaH (DUF805 family)
MLSIIGGMLFLGTMDRLISGDVVGIGKAINQEGGIVLIGIFMILMIFVMIGQANIFFKRIRDMGLPVLWSIVALFVISIGLNIAYPPHQVAIESTTIETATTTIKSASATMNSSNNIINIFNLIVFLALIFIPSNTFKR